MYKVPGSAAGTAGGTAGTLAMTGAPVGWWITFGVMVTVVGALLLAASIRRTQRLAHSRSAGSKTNS